VAMQRYAEVQILDAVHVRTDGRLRNGKLRTTGHRHQFDYRPRRGFLYVRSRAISSRTNDNHDTFPAEEIKKAYRTFVGKPVFVNHRNEDPGRARGVVIDAALHEDANPDGSPDTWVELLMEVDAVRFPVLARKILAGEIDRTSMGTNVEFSVCSFCGNEARTPLEYCAHIQRMKGYRLVRTTASGRKESVLVSEVCYGLGFFENSLLVEPPADPTAYFLGVDSRGVDAPTKSASSLGREGRAPTLLGATASRRVATPDEARDADLSPEEREERWPEMYAALQAEAAPRHADPSQHPWFQANPVHHDNIVAHWDRATDEEKDLGKRWYPDAHFVAKALGHAGLKRAGRTDATDAEAAHVGAGVLAAYSPQASWPVNMFNASNALRTGKAPGGKGSGVFATASMAGQAQKVMDGTPHTEVLKGPKIRDFAHLIEHGGDADPEQPHAVIDRHALSVAAGRRLHVDEIEHAPVANRHYYNHVVNQYHEAARRISSSEGEPIHAHQVQATTWLVRQRENAEADAAGSTGAERGRTQHARDDATRWQEHAQEHYPDLVGPGYHRATLRSIAYGEQVAPPQVDTLRPEDCPICGDRDTFDGETCQVCGYIAPPEQFTDPNLDLAGQVDLHGGADPDDDEESEDEDDPDDGDENEDDDKDEEPESRLRPTGRRHPEGTGVRMGNQARSNQAQRQRSRLTAALSQQQQTIQAQQAAIGDLRSVLAFVVDVAGLGGHPRVAALAGVAARPAQEDSPPRLSYRAGYQTGVRDRTSAANLASPAKLAEFEQADEPWQIGWDDGYHDRTPATAEALASRHTAADEDGEPVSRSSDQAWSPAATDDPQNYGAVPAPANEGVTPEATTDVQSTDVAVPQPAFNQLEDVTEQRDLIPPPPGEPSHVVQDIQTVPQPDIRPAFPIPEPTSFTSALDPQARFFAALRLARKRREAGVSTEDELALAQSIVEGGTSDEAVAVETATLEAVSGAARQARAAQPTAVRALVPRAASQRAMPSLSGAGQAPARRVQAGSGGSAPTPDEFLDM
jgi:hypothetical protein